MVNFFNIVYLAFIVAALEANFLSRSQQVGETCNGNANFDTTSFIVTPWPPERGQSMQCNMTGTFLLDEDVIQISIMTSFNHAHWSFVYVPINKSYKQGDTVNYVYSIPVPTVPGSYLEQVCFEQFEPVHQYISCWQFRYFI